MVVSAVVRVAILIVVGLQYLSVFLVGVVVAVVVLVVVVVVVVIGFWWWWWRSGGGIMVVAVVLKAFVRVVVEIIRGVL